MNVAVRYYTKTGNTKRLAEAGAAVLHEEKNLKPGVLAASVLEILENEQTASSLSDSIRNFAKPNAANDIYQDLLSLSQKEV